MNYGMKFLIPDGLKDSKLLRQPLIEQKPKIALTKADLFDMIKQRKKSIVSKYLGID